MKVWREGVDGVIRSKHIELANLESHEMRGWVTDPSIEVVTTAPDVGKTSEEEIKIVAKTKKPKKTKVK